MDDETRAAFSRIDRWFELSQGQHQQLRGDVQELRADVQELRTDVQELRTEVQELRAEVRSFRAWVTEQFADVRAAIRQLTHRVERLEQQRSSS